MIKKFGADNRQVTVIIILLFITLTAGIGLFCYSNFQLSIKVIAIAFLLFYFTQLLQNALSEYSMYLSIDDNGIESTRNRKNVRLSWDYIERLEYKGIKGIAITEKMIIHHSTGVIYVDCVFKQYTTVWKEIINRAEEQNPQIIIDKDLYSRLKIN